MFGKSQAKEKHAINARGKLHQNGLDSAQRPDVRVQIDNNWPLQKSRTWRPSLAEMTMSSIPATKTCSTNRTTIWRPECHCRRPLAMPPSRRPCRRRVWLRQFAFRCFSQPALTSFLLIHADHVPAGRPIFPRLKLCLDRIDVARANLLARSSRGRVVYGGMLSGDSSVRVVSPAGRAAGTRVPRTCVRDSLRLRHTTDFRRTVSIGRSGEFSI